MLEPNRWNYIEFEQPGAERAGQPAPGSSRSLFLEIEGQERVYTGAISRNSFLLRRYLPESLARRYQVLPIEMKHGVLKVAMVDPENQKLVRDLEREIGSEVRIQACRTTPEFIQQGLAAYRSGEMAPPIPLRSHRPTVLPPGPWVAHTAYRSPARVYWPAYMPVFALLSAVMLLATMALLYHFTPFPISH